MCSPMRELRKKFGWTKEKLSKLLETRPCVIGKIEAGKMRIPVRLYEGLMGIGWNPFYLAVAQEKFIKWRRDFHSSMRWGLPPSNS